MCTTNPHYSREFVQTSETFARRRAEREGMRHT